MTQARRFVGTVHVFQGSQKSNPAALYATKEGEEFVVAALVEPWTEVVGKGPTVNKAAGDFEIKWKAQPLPSDEYTGPHWEEGIKAEKPPAPPKPPAATSTAAQGNDATLSPPQSDATSDPPAAASSGS